MTERRHGSRRATDTVDAEVLPRDLDAERSILGASLLHSDAFGLVADILKPADFFRVAHQKIYSAMLDCREADRAIDFVTVKSRLGTLGELEDIGGPAYLASLSDGVPRSTNVIHYATIVVEKSRLRAAIMSASRLIQRASAEESLMEAAGEAAEELLTIGASASDGGAKHVGALVAGGMDMIQQAHDRGGAVSGVRTGLTDLDNITSGLQPSDLIIVAARPGVGKTSLALNIARTAATALSVLVFSLEMSSPQLFLRMLSSEARIDSRNIRNGYLSAADFTTLSMAVTNLTNTQLYIDDAASLTVFDVRSRARAHRAAHGLDLVVVDYLQLLRGSGRFENRTQEIGTISRGLKAMAKELAVPVIALSQLRRPPADASAARRPQLSDLREGGDIEADADMVWLIWRNDDDPAMNGQAEVIVAKSRSGPTGAVQLAWMPRFTLFGNLAA